MSDFKNVQPLYYFDKKDGKTPVYYGIGTFFNKQKAILLRLASEKDHFKLPETITDLKAKRLAALAQLIGTKNKLILGPWGRNVWTTGKEHTYYNTLNILIEKAQVNVQAQGEKSSSGEKSKSDLEIVLEALAKSGN